MNKKKLLSSAAAAALLTSVISQSVMAATDTGTANARIVTPIGVAETTEMNFGDIQPEAGPTTVTLSTAGVATPTGATIVTGSPSQGIFTVTGTEAATYSITLPADGTVTLSGPGPAMNVDGFNHDAGATPAIGVGGSSTLSIGAILSVAGSVTQTAGDYSGSYDVTVDYQ